MKTQNQIRHTLAQPEAIECVKHLLDASDGINRTELAHLICDQFGFFDPNGTRQGSGCLKALRELEKKGWFVLPEPRHTGGKASPRLPRYPVPEPQGVPDEVGEIAELELVLVKTNEQMRIWNALMIKDHPRGAGPFVGRQLCYLVTSEYGFLGGLGFSSAALHLEDRDQWIGWNWSERKAHLHFVVNMNRFLIRSTISCKNLASKVLGMTIQAFPKDFEVRYGYRPLLLESFVDTRHFRGTCYKAANWQFIGRSKGLGLQELPLTQDESTKDIYVYPLKQHFRLKLGLSEDRGLDALTISSGIGGENWAEQEFGNAPLGDKRLSNRLIEIASDKGKEPTRSYCGVAKGDWPKVKAYYRLIDKADDSAVTMTNILRPHRERTICRIKAQKTVLCIQDGSDLNYSNPDKCSGLGVIGSNQTDAKSKGLYLHSTLAVTTEGLPLGVLRAECKAPQSRSKEDKRPASKIPIEEKKTFCWIESVRDCAEIRRLMPQTTLVNVSDREADFFEMFDHHRCHGKKQAESPS